MQIKTSSRLCHQENRESFLYPKLIILLKKLTNFLGQFNQKGKQMDQSFVKNCNRFFRLWRLSSFKFQSWKRDWTFLYLVVKLFWDCFPRHVDALIVFGGFIYYRNEDWMIQDRPNLKKYYTDVFVIR
jgi:hypothetical protein